MAVINGTSIGETLNGTGEDDTINGLGGNDTLNGGVGNDTLDGGEGSDRMNGEDGDDELRSLSGVDNAVGGAGTDTLVADFSSATTALFNNGGPSASPGGGFSGNLFVNSSRNITYSEVERFVITGGSGNDTITTASGDDIVIGNGGDDVINLGMGMNTADGGDGMDRLGVDFSSQSGPVTIDLRQAVNSGAFGSFSNFESFANITGSSGNDSFTGAADVVGNEIFNLGDGDDTVEVVNGNDDVHGGLGLDTLVINYASATAALFNNGGPAASGGGSGFSGNFFVTSNRNVSYTQVDRFVITSGSGNDTITTATGDDLVNSGGGDDIVNLGSGVNSADGGTGLDRLGADFSGQAGPVTINLANMFNAGAFGSFSNFELFANVTGSSGDDSFSGAADIATNETFALGTGNDSAEVVNGSDFVNGGAGLDTLVINYASATAALINNGGPSASAGGGFSGNFFVNSSRTVTYSEVERFVINSGTGNDAITTASGDDVVNSGGGNDVINLGTGVNTADGGDGMDRLGVDFSGQSGPVTIDLRQAVNSGAFGSFSNFESFANITGSAGNDSFTGAADVAGGETYNLGEGHDTAEAVNGADIVNGGTGLDTLIVNYASATTAVFNNGGPAASSGGSGFSGNYFTNSGRQVSYTQVDRFVITTGSGNDTITAASGNDVIDGGAGNDSLNGGLGNDTASYATAASAVTASLALQGAAQNMVGAGTDTLNGFENLAGSAHGDTLIGDGSNNELTGRGGNDTLDGAAGSDTAIYSGNRADYLATDLGGGNVRLADQRAGAADGIDDLAGIEFVRFADGTVPISALFGVTITGTAGNDVISATRTVPGQPLPTDAGETLLGLGGNDRLDGAGGADTMFGGAGNDSYTISDVGDIASEETNAGVDDGGLDSVSSAISFTLGSFIENLTLVGSAVEGGGNGIANRITGNALDNVLRGGGGNDNLNGGLGADTLFGGSGNDIYAVDNEGDLVSEQTIAGIDDGGLDSVSSSISYSLGAFVENLTLTGSTAIEATGNDLANRLTGNAANNVLRGEAGNDALNGGLGADTMFGGAGNDSYTVDNAGDLVGEESVAGIDDGGIDAVTSAISYILGAHLENLTLSGSIAIEAVGNDLDNRITGNAANNVLRGNGGNDRLNGALGADTMFGGAGNDGYTVDNAGDVVSEENVAGVDDGGLDSVASSISHTLGAFIENLTLTGSSALDGSGNELNNRLTGNLAGNVLRGGGGNDSPHGGLGADTLVGGSGNDGYTVDDVGDVVSEETVAGVDDGGLDSVSSTVSFTLGSFLENLTLTGTAAVNGTGNDLANRITGNAGNNRLDGGGGNDALNGGLGADMLFGGSGNDGYTVDNVGDVVSEETVVGIDDGGTDSVASIVSFALGDFIENLTLTGTAAINGTGNDLANRITGNAAANRLEGGGGIDSLSGGLGADTLIGGAGKDVLTGGADADLFILDGPDPTSADRIADLVSGLDRIGIEAADYGLSVGNGLTADGALDPNWFVSGAGASATAIGHGQFVYDSKARQLLWDADGAGGAGGVLLASVAAVNAGDFLVL